MPTAAGLLAHAQAAERPPDALVHQRPMLLQVRACRLPITARLRRHAGGVARMDGLALQGPQPARAPTSGRLAWDGRPPSLRLG
jgi:hypothetical protein